MGIKEPDVIISQELSKKISVPSKTHFWSFRSVCWLQSDIKTRLGLPQIVSWRSHKLLF